MHCLAKIMVLETNYEIFGNTILFREIQREAMLYDLRAPIQHCYCS